MKQNKIYKIIFCIIISVLLVSNASAFSVSVNKKKTNDFKEITIEKNTEDINEKNKEDVNVSNNLVEIDLARNNIKLKNGIDFDEKLHSIIFDFSNNVNEKFKKPTKIPLFGLDWTWMDFNPGGDPNRNGGLFEGESWSVTKNVYNDDFDDTDDKIPEWASSSTLYSAVRSDEDLWDGTSADGAWCSAGGEDAGWSPIAEDSRGWAKVEKSFDIDNFIDTSKPGFCFVGTSDYVVDTSFYCDYKIHGGDFDDQRDHVYFNAYLEDSDREWPIGYQYHTGENDMPKNDGWCTNFWDPEYSGCTNPYEEFNDHRKNFIVDYTSGNTQYGYYLWNFLNYFGSTYGYNYKMKFELYIRLYGETWDPEYAKFWVDNAAMKLYYWFSDPPYTPYDPTPSNGATGVSRTPTLKWYGGDPDYYVNPIDTVEYKIYFGTSSSPPYKEKIGPFDADNTGPFSWNPSGTLDYETNYYWKIVAVDSYGLETAGSVWHFTTKPNYPPVTPPTPTGTTYGQANSEHDYYSSTTDPEGHYISYKFDWGDGTTSDWLGPLPSGQEINANHEWNCGGTYYVKVKAKDELGKESGWSQPPLEVTITNDPPYQPSKPNGPTNGVYNEEYCYSTSATDPESHQVYIKFDWGDGTNTGWKGPYNSGQSVQKCHTYNVPGVYEIRSKAKDECGLESSWSNILTVTMENLPPNTPSNPNPNNGETWVKTDVTLSWDGGDPNGGTVYYDIFLDTESPPGVYVEDITQTQYTLTNYLDELTVYYWQIVAEDQYGEISYGPIWSFTTREYNPPILTNYNGWPKGHIPDEKICQSAQFTFCVHYKDVDGDAPIEKKLMISNGKEFNMELFQGDPDDGDYKVLVNGGDIGGGDYTYYFWYKDVRHDVRYPEQGEEWSIEINNKPNKPTIQGPQSGVPKKQYTFSALASDTEGDYLKYKFDWGDGTESDWLPHDHWLGPGEPVKCNHSWNSMKSYVVKVKAMDEGCNDESQWSDGHNIQIPKNKAKKSIYLISLIEKIIQKFPLLKKIIKMIALK